MPYCVRVGSPLCLLYLSESGPADVITAGRFAGKVSPGRGGAGQEFCSNTWPKNIKQEHNGEQQIISSRGLIF